jgi:hypothetical protein
MKRNSFLVGLEFGEDSNILPEIFNPSKNWLNSLPVIRMFFLYKGLGLQNTP